MVLTRSKGTSHSQPKRTATGNSGKNKKKTNTSKNKRTDSNSRENSATPTERTLPDPLVNSRQSVENTRPAKSQKTNIFQSRFSPLDLETFEDKLDEWTLIGLQDAVNKQDSRRTKAPKEIKDLVKILRMEFEKRILMVALMAGVPQVVIWNLMGFGKIKGKGNPWIRFLSFCIKCLGDPLPEREDKDAWATRNQDMANKWHDLTKDQKDVFRDPYFFALAGLPDYTTVDDHDTDEDADDDGVNGVDTQQFDSSALAPAVFKLSDANKEKYQSIFNELVDIDKLHLCHGKPEPVPSMASLQKQSLIAVRKAHQEFAVVCQRNQISYYLTAASCGGVNGWSQTFSNNMDFGNWALKVEHIPAKFTNYVHGKEVAKEIEVKVAQPSDERRRRLAVLLDSLVDVHLPKCIFPKKANPADAMKKKGWKIKIVQEPESLLRPEDLLIGHRKVTDAVVKAWTTDIQNKKFRIEPISQSDSIIQDNPEQEHMTTATNQEVQRKAKRSEARHRLIALAQSRTICKKKQESEHRPKKRNRELETSPSSTEDDIRDINSHGKRGRLQIPSDSDLPEDM
ncbi:hypothetical protein DFH28DRAFT_896471 [Melampsora americana]|nr:hypothetical protein DFH28DRAFT_896471 [Melampsora americana]